MKMQVSQILSPVWKANEHRPKSQRIVTRDERVKARLGKGALNTIKPCHCVHGNTMQKFLNMDNMIY